MTSSRMMVWAQNATSRLLAVAADGGLEPLAFGVDEGNPHDRDVEEGLHQAGDAFEGGLRRGIENGMTPQGIEPGGFVGRQGE
jgi:hypothetical protein